MEETPEGVRLYQVTPPSIVLRTYVRLNAQPMDAFIMDSLVISGEGTITGEAGVCVGVGVKVGVKVGVMTGDCNQANVAMTFVNTADSAALSNSGFGGSKLPALSECRTKSMLMQAPLWVVE